MNGLARLVAPCALGLAAWAGLWILTSPLVLAVLLMLAIAGLVGLCVHEATRPIDDDLVSLRRHADARSAARGAAQASPSGLPPRPAVSNACVAPIDWQARGWA